VNLAVHLALNGVDLVLVDTDTQQSCVKFVDRRDGACITPRIHCVQRVGNVANTLRDLSAKHQVVIVDAGGRDSTEMRSAATVAHLVLVPTGASQTDLETMPRMNEIILAAKGFNPDLQAYAVLSMASSNPLVAETAEAKELLKEFSELKLADTVIRSRQIYKRAMADGVGVVETPHGQAKAEIQLLVQEFLDLE
jgi:chromosome partitioning protein